jgi:hypothetical protein
VNMKRFGLSASVLLVILCGASTAQTSGPKVIAKFPGAALKWVHAAEPEFQRRNLDLEKYNVSVVEERDSVTVALTSLDADPHARGSSGSEPAYAVEIGKKDLKVLRSYYER